MIVSAPIRRIAPERADAGISLSAFEPTRNLIRCGIISPTNPIIPETETHTAVTKEAVISRISLTLSGSMPRDEAVLSPRLIMSRSLAKKRKINSHKGDFGKVLVIGGSDQYCGAPAIASLAALKTGSFGSSALIL